MFYFNFFLLISPGFRENKSNVVLFSQWLCGISPSHSLARLSHSLWFPPDVQHFYVSWAAQGLRHVFPRTALILLTNMNFGLVLSCRIVDAFVTLANMNPLIRRNCRVLLPFCWLFLFHLWGLSLDYKFYYTDYKASAIVKRRLLFFSVSLKTIWDKHLVDFILIICCFALIVLQQ